MSNIATPVLFGQFEKSQARQYLSLFKREGIAATALQSKDKSVRLSLYNIYVTQEELGRAVELIKEYEYHKSEQGEEHRKKSERKAITVFLLFAVGFILYIVFRYH
jgi:hypothetical protein